MTSFRPIFSLKVSLRCLPKLVSEIDSLYQWNDVAAFYARIPNTCRRRLVNSECFKSRIPCREGGPHRNNGAICSQGGFEVLIPLHVCGYRADGFLDTWIAQIDWPAGICRIVTVVRTACALEEFIEQKDPDHMARWKMNALPASMNHEKIGQSLNDMRWFVVTMAADVPPLLSSDRPLFVSGAFGAANCYLTLPIAKDRLFVATCSEEMERKFKSQPQSD
jgi:hypothetical protein